MEEPSGYSHYGRAREAVFGAVRCPKYRLPGCCVPSVWALRPERRYRAHPVSRRGPEFTARAVSAWLDRLGVKTLFSERGSPWENGYIESLDGKLRDELLNREVFTSLAEAGVFIELWRREHNESRPNGALGYRPLSPEAIPAAALGPSSGILVGGRGIGSLATSAVYDELGLARFRPHQTIRHPWWRQAIFGHDGSRVHTEWGWLGRRPPRR